MVALYIFIPINIRVFGAEAFGVISYATTIQAILALLDLGISTLLKREFVIEPDKSIRNRLLTTVECILGTIILILSSIAFLFSHKIAPSVIHATSISGNVLSTSLFLMIVAALVQVLFMIYQGGLWGLGKINISNGLLLCSSLARTGGAVLFAWIMGSSLIAFFAFQLLSIIFFTTFSRFLIYKNLFLNTSRPIKIFDTYLLKKKMPYAGGVLLIGVLAALNSQADKLILSSKLPVFEFSAYSIGFTLSQLPVIFISPLLNVFFPSLSNFSSNNNISGLQNLTRSLSLPVFFLSSNIACALFFYYLPLLNFWISDTNIIEGIIIIFPFLIIGGLMQSLTVMPYIISLATADTKTILKVQILTMIIFFPMLFFSIQHFGMKGAAATWGVTNCLVCPLYAYFIIKKNMSSPDSIKYIKNFSHISIITSISYFLINSVIGTWGDLHIISYILIILCSLIMSLLICNYIILDFSTKKIISLLFY